MTSSRYHSLDPLIERIKVDHPDLIFKNGQKFSFRPPRTITIGPKEPHMELLLMHELGHALLGHNNYGTHIDRLKMESAAWEKAKELSKIYGIVYVEGVAQTELDTYRDWLHQKSLCPICGLTRYQDPGGIYHCPHCESFHRNQKRGSN